MIYVLNVDGKGRGVFASRRFSENELIECSPVLVFSREDAELIEKTNLHQYYYNWKDGGGAVGLGHTSLYNHSTTPSVSFTKHFNSNEIEIVALREIEIGEELTIDYRKDYEGEIKLWFEVKE